MSVYRGLSAADAGLREKVSKGATLWLGGAFDSLSARVVEQAGFDGVFATGFGISASLLGEPDMELYTLTENVSAVRSMTHVVNLPVIADADTGYGSPLNVARTVREFERAGAAGLVLEDQVSPKRCPAATNDVSIVPVEEALARIRSAVDHRKDGRFLVIARTDASNPSEAIERAALYVEAGADVVQPISRTFCCYEDLVKLSTVCGRRLSLQIMQGTWMADLKRDQIEAVAAIASYPLVALMTVVQAMRENLNALSERRTGNVEGLPCSQMTMKNFKSLIGWETKERLLAQYTPLGKKTQ